jgi:hypothetical protein
MNTKEALAAALEKLKEMTDNQFNEFLESLPTRVQLCVKGGLVHWQDVLPEWYIVKFH